MDTFELYKSLPRPLDALADRLKAAGHFWWPSVKKLAEARLPTKAEGYNTFPWLYVFEWFDVWVHLPQDGALGAVRVCAHKDTPEAGELFGLGAECSADLC